MVPLPAVILNVRELQDGNTDNAEINIEVPNSSEAESITNDRAVISFGRSNSSNAERTTDARPTYSTTYFMSLIENNKLYRLIVSKPISTWSTITLILYIIGLCLDLPGIDYLLNPMRR